MTISEPATLLTDYLLAILGSVLGARLLGGGRARRSVAAALWGFAFLALALGALAGGSAHGFVTQLGTPGTAVLWKVTVYALGLASLFLVCGEIAGRFSGQVSGVLMVAAAIKFLTYAIWMSEHDDFRWVIYEYGSGLVAVLLLEVWAWLAVRAPSAPWVVAGILVSFAGAAVQQSGFSLHRHFNHNDLYHVIQMAGLYLLYRGGLQLGAAAAWRGSMRH